MARVGRPIVNHGSTRTHPGQFSGICQRCNRLFTASRPWARFCSGRCRWTAHNERILAGKAQAARDKRQAAMRENARRAADAVADKLESESKNPFQGEK